MEFSTSTIVMALLGCGWSFIGLHIASSIKEAKDSIQELNVNVAVVVEKVGNHEKRIEKLEGWRA